MHREAIFEHTSRSASLPANRMHVFYAWKMHREAIFEHTYRAGSCQRTDMHVFCQGWQLPANRMHVFYVLKRTRMGSPGRWAPPGGSPGCPWLRKYIFKLIFNWKLTSGASWALLAAGRGFDFFRGLRIWRMAKSTQNILSWNCANDYVFYAWKIIS